MTVFIALKGTQFLFIFILCRDVHWSILHSSLRAYVTSCGFSVMPSLNKISYLILSYLILSCRYVSSSRLTCIPGNHLAYIFASDLLLHDRAKPNPKLTIAYIPGIQSVGCGLG